MCYFFMGVADLVMEECRTAMLYVNMTLARLLVYALLIKVSKIKRLLEA